MALPGPLALDEPETAEGAAAVPGGRTEAPPDDPETTEGVAPPGHPLRRRFRTGPGGQALPRMRFIVVPQTGHLPLAMRRPESLTETSPSKSRFSLHFTQ